MMIFTACLWWLRSLNWKWIQLGRECDTMLTKCTNFMNTVFCPIIAKNELRSFKIVSHLWLITYDFQIQIANWGSNRLWDSHPRYISQIGCCFQNSRDGKQVDYLAVTALSLMFVSRGWKSVKHPNATLDVFECCQKKIFTLSTWRTNWNLNIWLLQPLNASFFWDVPYKCSIKNHSKYHLSRVSKK